MELKLLLVIPIIIVPLLVQQVVSSQPETYRSYAAIWTTEPDIGALSLGNDDLRATPADRQARVITELLRTNQFTLAIAEQSGLLALIPQTADPIASELWKRQAADVVRRSVSVGSRGVNLLSVTAIAPTPQLAHDLVDALISEFQRRFESEAARQSAIAIDYFTQQLTVAGAELSRRQQVLSAYVEEHPEVTERGVIDLQYETLANGERSQAVLVSTLQRSLQDAELGQVTASQGQAARFLVEDDPSLPLQSEAVKFTTRFAYPLAGAVFGAMISGAYLFIVFRSDHSIRSKEDFAGIDVRVLGYVPEVSSKQHQPIYRRLTLKKRHFARLTAAGLIVRPSGREGQS